MTVFILDDDRFAIETLQTYVQQTNDLQLLGSETNPVLGLRTINDIAPDILLIDVDMPQMSGLDVASTIRTGSSIIFTTAYKEFSFDAFELSAVDYLLKPVSYARFYKAIDKVSSARLSHSISANASIIIKGDAKDKFHYIQYDEIIYINAAENYIQIHCRSEIITAYLTLSELSQQLPSSLFQQVHRSYVINLNHLRLIDAGHVKMMSGDVIPVGTTFRQQITAVMRRSAVVSKRSRIS